MVRKLSVGFVILFLISLGSFAQETSSFKSEGKGAILLPNYNEQKKVIQFRWIPNSSEAWILGAQKGYNIYRVTVSNVKVEKVKLNNTPIKPYSLEKFKSIVDTSDEAKGAVLGVLIDSVTIGSNNMEEAKRLYDRQQMNYGLTMIAANNSLLVAKITGLYYEDKTAKPGETYIYRLEVNGVADSTFKPTIAEVKCCTPIVKATISSNNSIFDEKMVTLKWKIALSTIGYAYYDVYRKINGTFVKINKHPVIANAANRSEDDQSITYQDSIPQPGLTYSYKIQGTTLFGDKGAFSKVISGVCVRKLKRAPRITSVEYIKGGMGSEVKWIVSDIDSAYIKKIEVFKTDVPVDGVYRKISDKPLSGNARSFIDYDVWPANYYAIKIVGVNDDSLASIPFFFQGVDSIPPAPSTGLAAKVDTSWIVRLTWKPNKEKDLFGYRVFKMTDLKGDVIRLTVGTIQDTIWIDTLDKNNVNYRYYYMVAAIDKRYNASKFSEPLMVKIPSRTPPVPPLITDYETKDDGITIYWASSPSIGVEKELIYRKGELDADWKLLKTQKFISDDSISKFRDSTTKPGKSYIYTMRSEVASGWKSEYAKSVTINHIDNKIRGKIENLRLVVSREQRTIKVAWDYKPKGVMRFEIYKGKDDNQPIILTSIIDGKTEYYDSDIKAGHKYTYKIRAVHNDGASSLMSVPESIMY